jgi:cytochrome c oxidase subunit I
VLLNQVQTLRAWRADHAGERIPLLSYVSLLTYVMWGIASIGIAVQVLVFILPWTFGWTEGIDPQFSRILFWFTGHPIVYFWLLPVYVSWYLMIPKQVGGTLYSDGLVRLVFIMFLVLSLPVGVHHQFTDPGIPMSSKAIHYVLTVGVFFPSMVTAFTVMAALESGGRAAGGKGLLGWIRRLPWGDPSVTAQLVAMLTFVFGGISGLVNASLTVNVVVHNTAFVPGHFHLTVGSAVALSIIGISYWLVPYLTGKRLVGRRWALAQAWLWGAGALLFGRGQIAGGLDGMPRRVPITSASYELEAWASANLQTGIGGILMVVSGLIFVVLLVATLARGSAVEERIEIPVAEPAHGARESWRVLDNLGLWVLVTVLVTAFAYGHVLLHYLPMSPTSPGFQLW